ncbi:MAG: class I SAM-dependent methyltransferase [Terricaulis sp.]
MRRPRFIAEQARHAKGPLGRFVAFIMAGETWAENLKAIDALDIQPADHVLDIGCGHGRSLTELAKRAPRGRVAGADPSELMVETAVHRNRAHVRARLVDVVLASADRLPFPDAAFDKVLCVHVLYFWDDLGAGLREIARVMKPRARLSLVFHTAANHAAVRTFPDDIYRFPALADVVAALTVAEFIFDENPTFCQWDQVEPMRVTVTKSPPDTPFAL